MGGEVSVLSSCPRCGAVRSIAGGPARGDLGDGVLDLGARDHVGVTAATGQHPRCMLAALTPPAWTLGGASSSAKAETAETSGPTPRVSASCTRHAESSARVRERSANGI